jgi:hypothetical protein
VGGACGSHGRGEKSKQDLAGKPEGKRSFLIPRRRREDGIRMNFMQSGW